MSSGGGSEWLRASQAGFAKYVEDQQKIGKCLAPEQRAQDISEWLKLQQLKTNKPARNAQEWRLDQYVKESACNAYGEEVANQIVGGITSLPIRWPANALIGHIVPGSLVQCACAACHMQHQYLHPPPTPLPARHPMLVSTPLVTQPPPPCPVCTQLCPTPQPPTTPRTRHVATTLTITRIHGRRWVGQWTLPARQSAESGPFGPGSVLIGQPSGYTSRDGKGRYPHVQPAWPPACPTRMSNPHVLPHVQPACPMRVPTSMSNPHVQPA